MYIKWRTNYKNRDENLSSSRRVARHKQRVKHVVCARDGPNGDHRGSVDYNINVKAEESEQVAVGLSNVLIIAPRTGHQSAQLGEAESAEQ